ncbi:MULTISPECIES: response regulator transcription factor [Kordiimonas]|uniref:response regulator transcription factor n=1 Tax=Kordiimonas TaxID=288021 RepID=UPI002579F91D|nr:response regulator transcription factor [Kordiimonas sp. UBA4487]
MKQKKNIILIVDDEPQIRKLLCITLEAHNMKPEEADEGRKAIRMAVSVKPDLMLLDLGLPDIDGKQVIKEVREWSNLPIIVCSVRNSDKEMIEAFDLGADDYVTKPFNPDVLLARITANLRKAASAEAGQPVLENGRIQMDLVKHEVLVDGNRVEFTPKEYDLLRYFLVHRGKMLTHRQILHEVWGAAHGDDTQYLRVYISQVREKVEPTPSSPDYIVTEPGIGYRMEVI